ncbi:MAG TPA: diguanylate cyclase [Acetobacteraceae bacterium]|nr:diguanylate cyclase [Acetobacteraceae bacterium]
MAPVLHDAPAGSPADGPADPAMTGLDPRLGRVLLESRQRWRDLVGLAADFAFETNSAGQFTFVVPDPALGWPTALLLDQPAERLLADPAGGFDPFHPSVPLRGRHAWLRRADGTVACLAFSCAPLLDPAGRIVGARGLGIDVTEQNQAMAEAAAALRRSAMVEHILARMRQEVLAPRMMRAVLEAVRGALGAEGVAVVGTTGEGAAILHQSGHGAEGLLGPAAALVAGAEATTRAAATIAAGCPLLVSTCLTRFGERAGLAIWRPAGGRAWDSEEQMLTDAAGGIVRVVLEHQAIQREMARQARTDSLTGLLNRRAFLEELGRHIERLDRETAPGTMIFVDLDNFKPVNDRFGHEIGDQVLCRTAALLRRTVRPTDLVARLGGDEFALWLNGADHMTAAERAESLRLNAPGELAEVVGAPRPRLSLSIGIATRRVDSGEDIDSVMRRADFAMFEVKRQGRGHWRVAPDVEP